MKRILFGLLAALMVLPVCAQEAVQFSVGQGKILGQHTPAQKEKLESKVTQILGRNSAGAGDGTFVIEPVLSLNSSKQTEGLMRNVTLTEAEFSLSAKNGETGVVYYSVTVPLEAAVTGSASDAVDALISSIKVKDAAYTRFIRNARRKIEETLPAPSPEQAAEQEQTSVGEPAPEAVPEPETSQPQ